MDDMKEQPEEHAKLTETGSHGVCSLSTMNSLLEVSDLSDMKSMAQSQICEDTQSIDMDICSENGTSEVYKDLPGKIDGMYEQIDEQAKLIETDFREVRHISIMNSPLLPVNDDLLFETAHLEELSKGKSLEAADCSVQSKVCIPSKSVFSCGQLQCEDVEHRKDETAEIDNLSCEVQQDAADAPVMCVDDNLITGSGKNTLSTAAANNRLSMIEDDLPEKDKKDGFPHFCDVEEGTCGASFQDKDSCQASHVMLKDPDPCETELRRTNNHSVITDTSSGMCAEDEFAITCVITEEEKGFPFEDQQDNKASCVKSISSEETNSYKDEMKSPNVLASTPLFEQDCGVDMNGDIFLHVESAPTITDVELVVPIIKQQLLSKGLERTDEDNLLVTSQRSPVLVGNNSYEESTLGEQEIDSLVVLHNRCSTGGEMGNEIQQSLEQDKMIITDYFHDTEQENQNEDAHDGFSFDDGRSIEESVKAEYVIISETITAGSTGLVTHVFCQVPRTEEASRLTFKQTAMEKAQYQLSHESLLADRYNTNCSVECTDYLTAPDNIYEQPEDRPVLENPDHMIGQICEGSHGLSSDNYLLPREISTVEEAPEGDVPSGSSYDVLEHSNGCSTEPETLIVCSLQTPAMQGSGLEEVRKTEVMNDMIISGSFEVESSVENVNLVMVAGCEENGEHLSQFESSLKNECQDPSAENSIADEVDNDTSTTEIMQGVEANLLDNKTLAAKGETHVVKDRTYQSDLQHEIDAAVKDKYVTASP
ncbi:MAG: hypothetical protein Q8881_02605 [Sweet potato little leaf phytoplasma]|nr:hypothetical protein [Sweet potato little leaf phytoplasma]